MLRRVALVKTDVSEEVSASFIRVTGIVELGTTLAVNSNRRTLRASVAYVDLRGWITLRCIVYREDGLVWTGLVCQDRFKWGAVVHAVMNFGVP
jgi:hypothetical protein